MKLFISWSGQKSNAVASTLRGWIPDVLQSVQPWMSERDIEAGARWSPQVAAALEETKFGVICLTKENATAPWLLFETGALAKTISETFVCPYLIDMEPVDIPAGPLAQFQAKRANKEGTYSLINTINAALKDERLSEEQLKRTFERWWETLDTTLQSLTKFEVPRTAPRRIDEMVKETLSLVRQLARDSGRADAGRRMRAMGFEPLGFEPIDSAFPSRFGSGSSAVSDSTDLPTRRPIREPEVDDPKPVPSFEGQSDT